MATGNPNQDKLVHFIAKVRDTDGQFKPIYTPLDATDRVYGNVLLSDEVDYPAQDEDKNCAATGVRAATPKAVKSVAAIANNKLDKHTPFPQTVQGMVEFKSPLTFDKGAFVPKGEFITGDLKGNATTADKLKKAINLSTKSGTLSPSGSVLFDGSKDVTIPLGDLDATKLKGLVPLDSIPQGALERVYNADSIDDAIQKYNDAPANEKPFQEGDTVRITSVTPPVMYVVVGNPGLKKNYVEYAAGTATRAYEADQALKLTTDAGSDTKPVYFKDGVPVELKGNVGEEPVVGFGAGIAGGSTSTTFYGMKPIYLKDGELTSFTENVGSASKPVYSKEGCIIPIDYSIKKSVPADAVFTDTTYDVFEANVDGLVPAPTEDEAANEQLFLKSDGTWGELVGGSVTGVKGDTEHEYRTRDVNLTYENIGSVGLYDPSYNWKPSDVEDYDFDPTYFWGQDATGDNAFLGIKIKTNDFTEKQKAYFNFFYPASYEYADKDLIGNDPAADYMTITAAEGTIIPFYYNDSTNSYRQDLYITFQLKSNKAFNPNIVNLAGQEAVNFASIDEAAIENFAEKINIWGVRYENIEFTDKEYKALDVTVSFCLYAQVDNLGTNEQSKFVLKLGEFCFEDLTSRYFGKRIYLEWPKCYFNSTKNTVPEANNYGMNLFPVKSPINRSTDLYGCQECGYSFYDQEFDLSQNISTYKYYPALPYPVFSDAENSTIPIECFFQANALYLEDTDLWNEQYLNQKTKEDKINFLNSMIPSLTELSGMFSIWTAESGAETQFVVFNKIDSSENTENVEIYLAQDGVFGFSVHVKTKQLGQRNLLWIYLRGLGLTFKTHVDLNLQTDTNYLSNSYAAHDTVQPIPLEFTSSEVKPASKQSMKALSPNVEDKIYTTEGGFMPGAATTNLGSITEPFNEIYAKVFDGELLGNATTATTANRLNSELALNGNVTGSVSFNSDGNHTMTTTIANDTVTLAKLASDVGTVAVQSAQPTDSNVKLWIKI